MDELVHISDILELFLVLLQIDIIHHILFFLFHSTFDEPLNEVQLDLQSTLMLLYFDVLHILVVIVKVREDWVSD